MRKAARFLALCLLTIESFPAFAQAPPAIPALPDTERRTSYSITASTGPLNVGFQLYGDGSDAGNWVQVYVNGVPLTQAGNWALSSPSGSIAFLPRPIADAQITFTVAQTGTVQIVGARRPRRASQFPENRGVAARDHNQAITDLTAQVREAWDLRSRTPLAPPGETMSTLPPATTRANQQAIFDAAGNLTSAPSSGPLNVSVSPYDTPELHGAVGDGVANDTVPVTAWLSASNRAQILSCKTGAIYAVDPITISQTLANVPGSIDGRCTLKARAVSASPTLTVENVQGLFTNFTIKNLVLDANNNHAYPLKIHGSQHAYYQDVEAKNGAVGGVWLSGEPGFGIYYTTFENLFTHNNAGPGLIAKSINNAGNYYIAADTILGLRSQFNGSYGADIDYASLSFIGSDFEANGTCGLNSDHAIQYEVIGTHIEANNATACALTGTANTTNLHVLGGRTIGTISASLLAGLTNTFETGDSAASPLMYLGGIRFQNGGIAMGGTAGIANAINNNAPWTMMVSGSSEVGVVPDSSVTSGLTGMTLTYNNGSIQRSVQVSIGAADSGGAGFKLLRVPN